jgi:D-alanyl-D-alanine carboxypeptidase/D-alanyl-D-alanine-endopeptidase (penicillin-binding protein 4)
VEAEIDAILATPPLDQVHWGVLARDLQSGEIVVSRNAGKKFVPASNMKILVTAVALAKLGPDHRFHTELWGAGELQEGELDGDLVLVGTGDPTLSDRYWESNEAPLQALADSLHGAGVRRVRGALVVDASRWDSTTVAGTWMRANLPATYSATGGAFAVAEGETRIVVHGGARPGDPVRIEWSPAGEEAFVVGNVETVDPAGVEDLDVGYLPESRRLRVTGAVPAGSTGTERVATRDPVRQATAALARALEGRGIEIEGGWEVVWGEARYLGGGCRAGRVPECSRATRLAGLESPPMSEVARGILEPSQNWMTEQVVRYLGAGDSVKAGWAAGLDTVAAVLVREVGVDSLDLSLRDGSGLSAYNLVTPQAVLGVLEWTDEQPWREAYRAALAAPGEEDSTLERRLTSLGDRLQAKTGTISNVNSLSGFLRTDDGRDLVFSILTNGSGLPPAAVRSAMDRVVQALARIRALGS